MKRCAMAKINEAITIKVNIDTFINFDCNCLNNNFLKSNSSNVATKIQEIKRKKFVKIETFSFCTIIRLDVHIMAAITVFIKFLFWIFSKKLLNVNNAIISENLRVDFKTNALLISVILLSIKF